MQKSITTISKATTHREIAEFWDTHSIVDYWDQTKPVEFEVDIQSETWCNTMANYITVAKINDVQPGKMKTFKINGKRVLIANLEGTFFATQDVCTHDNGPLGDGELIGEDVECPRHGARFNVKTGKVSALPAMLPIKTLPVKIEGDEIQIAMG